MHDTFFPKIFEAVSERLKIYTTIFKNEHGVSVYLHGGRAHLGALVIATPENTIQVYASPGHKDDLPARSMAARLASACGCKATVLAGIHFDRITKYEIEEVLRLCEMLTNQIITALSHNKGKMEHKMIDVKSLEQFAEYIRSGALEECFKCGSEDTRYQILELLEKLMDVAELADETATRLIFRGLHPLGRHFEHNGGGSDNTLQ